MTFSIITCTYNSAQYLQKNIESVTQQTHTDYEHIFIDGFSTDGTVDIIKNYQKQYPDKVKLYQYKPQGIAHAMNKGIVHARGEYINHLHADDEFYDTGVLHVVYDNIIRSKNPDMVCGKAKLINEKKGSFLIMPHRKFYQKKLWFWLLLVINYIPHQSVFLKKDVFENYGGFDEKLKTTMDDDYWIRLSRENVRVKFIDKIICNFSIREDTQSSVDRFNTEFLTIYKKYFKNILVIRILFCIERCIKIIIYKTSKI